MIYNIADNSETKLRYVVEIESDATCSNSVEATVINHRFIPTITADAVVCGDELAIEGKAPAYGTYTGTWAGSGLTFEPVADESNKVVVKGLVHGNNNITWTVKDSYDKGFTQSSRSGEVISYPSRFLMVGNMNACACGGLGDPDAICTCTAQALRWIT